ncbi:LCP family protein [Nocardioides sp. TF02-7]|uniref:LCP family protein n=1 Tax=Nocardioides sp. TF02-7 TaxID=2917724 RepID=UPI001F05CDB9|nr:LCP family protein [Nocardioides sp. TF02-7]UMG91151.1 LCP family protein [Nocardioides sp. TF02-7]
MLALALLVGVGGWVWVLNSRLGDIPRFDAELDRPGRPERVEGSALNVLLVGVDAGPGHDLREQLQTGDWVEGSFRSDTMMVWHLSEDRDSSQVVSLPRDAWVEIPGRGRAKLNAAFSFGGPRLLAHTLEETAGVFVDHVVVVDFEGFAEVTETLGGVEVPMADGTTSRLEGAEALAYVRDRKSLPEGDFDRIDRQQHFLRAVLEQAVSGSRTNPLRLTGLVGDLAELVVLDSEFDQGLIRSLAMTITRKGAGEFTWLTAPHHGTATIDGQSVVELDVRATRALFQAIARDDFERYRRTHDVDLLPPPTESIDPLDEVIRSGAVAACVTQESSKGHAHRPTVR